ncbi:MAG: polysaccharide biosynthesis/export family protein [Planctomycetes bacterium]|nr:polysaccharide biosynthesis/export family protein [Planctomycetota bacterium]
MARLKQSVRWLPIAGLMLACALSGGCTALTNPVADGIPVRLLPPELLGPSRCDYQTIPLTALQQAPADAYLLDAGDVIGISARDFISDQVSPPAPGAPSLQGREQNRLPPGWGHPITVQEDGKITLPGVPPLSVKGLTIEGARAAIKKHYETLQLEQGPREKLIVTLVHPRQFRVLVFRQEATGFQAGQDGPVPTSKRNTGHVVELPAYQNDVLHALARTGGLPDLDAYNEVIIHRDSMNKPQVGKAKPATAVGETLRIPLRQPFGSPMPFGKDDVVLRTGDVVFLEARDEQVFFTAGLLPPGKHMLPRDHDLDVLEAITMVRGPLYNGAFGGSNLSGTLIAPGLGNPSPSLLIVVRRIPGRGQVPIAVDLRAAMRYPQERIVIRPGDVLVLQEKPAEALARYMGQTFFNFEMAWNVFSSRTALGVLNAAGPDRLGTRAATFNVTP